MPARQLSKTPHHSSCIGYGDGLLASRPNTRPNIHSYTWHVMHQPHSVPLTSQIDP
ncbi:hypothetical protein CHLRE_06g298326v5 [Chlamydomonas reinhardtii]|uniref:Uncharacterized protein n=1 Tax=Chlamydomonas reinhardtii TaxID=3055 RepID=A0A2K3DQV9_CHLRE|nr:uncharacterized protein CHLRE_06g298326v5 [Chlamydomonas reinhardtii]PNW82887.1 hypothetical protein CHLRE_06g298326v5 [Chlamydomonas reinhardtii]